MSAVRPLAPIFQLALLSIHDHLTSVPEKWAITGSLGFWLHGMDVPVGDIDLQTTSAGAYFLEEALGGVITQPVQFSESATIRSHYGSQQLNGVQIEIMGEVEKRLPGGQWIAPPDLEVVSHRLSWQGRFFPVMKLAYEEQAYRTLGRVRRANQIADFLRQRGSGRRKLE